MGSCFRLWFNVPRCVLCSFNGVKFLLVNHVYSYIFFHSYFRICALYVSFCNRGIRFSPSVLNKLYIKKIRIHFIKKMKLKTWSELFWLADKCMKDRISYQHVMTRDTCSFLVWNSKFLHLKCCLQQKRPITVWCNSV